MPTQFSVKCNAPPSMFSNPKAEDRKEDEKKAVTTAVLSTTARAKARMARKESKKTGGVRAAGAKGEGAAGGMERVLSYVSAVSQQSAEETEAPKAEEDAAKGGKKDREPLSFVLSNPARALPCQV